LAYTTISTTLDRLYKKGILARDEAVGRGGSRYVYRLHSEDKVKGRVVKGFVDRLLTAFGPSIISTLHDYMDEIPKEDLKRLEGMIAGDFAGSRLSETCAELCKKMNITGVNLREATVGNAFCLDNKGRKVVAVSPELVSSMSPAEVEAVIAHELSHLKNKDSREKGLARLAKFAFVFDPVLHLVEAAVHRERELLADQSSVKYTQKPLALASALLKVHSALHASLPGPRAGLCVGRKGQGLLSRYADLD